MNFIDKSLLVSSDEAFVYLFCHTQNEVASNNACIRGNKTCASLLYSLSIRAFVASNNACIRGNIRCASLLNSPSIRAFVATNHSCIRGNKTCASLLYSPSIRAFVASNNACIRGNTPFVNVLKKKHSLFFTFPFGSQKQPSAYKARLRWFCSWQMKASAQKDRRSYTYYY